MRDRDFSLDEVPFGLDPELGTIRHSEQVCPGVYFLTVEKEGHILLREYYAVMETAEIILKVNSYGQLNTPPETVQVDRRDGACRPAKWCRVTAAMVHWQRLR